MIPGALAFWALYSGVETACSCTMIGRNYSTLVADLGSVDWPRLRDGLLRISKYLYSIQNSQLTSLNLGNLMHGLTDY